MTTVVDICNLALANLGDEATVSSIDPPDQSAQAQHCARFYPMALRVMLDAHYWGWATTRSSLNLLSAAPTSGWLYAYAMPNNSINIIGIFLSGAIDDQKPQDYECESLPDGTSVIYTNILNPICRYTLDISDPNKFQPAFVQALTWLLSSYLAGPVLKGAEGMKMAMQCLQIHRQALSVATASDAAQRKIMLNHRPEFISVRGIAPQPLDDLGGFAR